MQTSMDAMVPATPPQHCWDCAGGGGGRDPLRGSRGQQGCLQGPCVTNRPPHQQTNKQTNQPTNNQSTNQKTNHSHVNVTYPSTHPITCTLPTRPITCIHPPARLHAPTHPPDYMHPPTHPITCTPTYPPFHPCRMQCQ